jgi:hypothetical protein
MDTATQTANDELSPDDMKLAIRGAKIKAQIEARQYDFSKMSDGDCNFLIHILSKMRKEIKAEITLNQFGMEDETCVPYTISIDEAGKLLNLPDGFTRDDVMKRMLKFYPWYEDKYNHPKKGKQKALKGSRSIAIFERTSFEEETITFYFNRYIFWISSIQNT